MRVLLHYDAGPALRGRLADSIGEGLQIDVCAEADQSRFEALIGHCDVLWHVLKPIDAAVIARAPRLALIQKIGIGVNTIDRDAARRRGIAVCNMPGTNSQAVAEMTLALMLSALRRLPARHNDSRSPVYCFQRSRQSIEHADEIARMQEWAVAFAPANVGALQRRRHSIESGMVTKSESTSRRSAGWRHDHSSSYFSWNTSTIRQYSRPFTLLLRRQLPYLNRGRRIAVLDLYASQIADASGHYRYPS